MTTREWLEADQDDADRVRAWPAQDAQEPNDDFESAFCFWKIEALENANEEHRAEIVRLKVLVGFSVTERDGALAEIATQDAEIGRLTATLSRMTRDVGHYSDCECGGGHS